MFVFYLFVLVLKSLIGELSIKIIYLFIYLERRRFVHLMMIQISCRSSTKSKQKQKKQKAFVGDQMSLLELLEEIFCSVPTTTHVIEYCGNTPNCNNVVIEIKWKMQKAK